MRALELMKSIRRKSEKARCKRGHPLNSITKYQRPGGYIYCRVCVSDSVSRYYQRNRDKITAQKREYYRKLREAA